MEDNKAQTTEQSPAEKGVTVFTVNGEQVKLGANIVRRYLVSGNAPVTDEEVSRFISICMYNKLNPFLGEAYLIKFEGKDPKAQMIVSKEALLKRADTCENYEGIEAGIIVERNGEIVELEGSFSLATDKLLGGWAKVYRSDRKVPTTAKVSLAEYDKGSSIWGGKKATMISKVAKVQALREAFPAQLGALYTAEEKGLDAPAEERAAKLAEIGAKTIETQNVEFEEVKAEQPAPDPQPAEVEPPYARK